MGPGIKFTNEISDTTAKTADVKTKIYIPSNRAHRSLMKTPNLSWEKIASHYPPSSGIKDWEKLQPEKHWCEGNSATELANSWETAKPDLPPKIAALFCGSAELLAAIPEHKTPLPPDCHRGPSQSDVLAFIRLKDKHICTVSVEGKKNEQFGDSTVGGWLAEGEKTSEQSKENREIRLDYVLGKLGLSGRASEVQDIRWQLLHRTAAAVIETKRFNADCAAMIVQSFSPQHTWFEDFAEFLDLFGIDSAKRDKIYKTDKPAKPLYFGWASP